MVLLEPLSLGVDSSFDPNQSEREQNKEAPTPTIARKLDLVSQTRCLIIGWGRDPTPERMDTMASRRN